MNDEFSRDLRCIGAISFSRVTHTRHIGTWWSVMYGTEYALHVLLNTLERRSIIVGMLRARGRVRGWSTPIVDLAVPRASPPLEPPPRESSTSSEIETVP